MACLTEIETELLATIALHAAEHGKAMPVDQLSSFARLEDSDYLPLLRGLAALGLVDLSAPHNRPTAAPTVSLTAKGLLLIDADRLAAAPVSAAGRRLRPSPLAD